MSVWAYHRAWGAAEEAQLTQRDRLTLPFDGMPDFTGALSQSAYRQRLQEQLPELPPESLRTLLDRSWGLYSAVHEEDVIAVSLPIAGEVAVAQVTGDYRYDNGMHTIGVNWLAKRFLLARLKRHPALIPGEGMSLITLQQTKNLLREQLPHSYNRFAKWKWLIVLVVGLQMIGTLLYTLKSR
ncbi:MAG: hypothetical protein SFT92_07570 [Rickettsiales bacterium]|nr:hypothetical protein [Rickettsiales bacterium]